MVESPNVLILTGAPGAGKTATARLLTAGKQRAVHLESDAFFRFIQTGYIDPWRPESHQQNTVVMRIVAAAASGYADAGYFTVVDGIISPGWFFEPLRDSLRHAGLRVAYAVLRPPLEVCISRAASRVSDEVVERLWQGFADLGSLERHVIEVATEGTQEIASLVARRLLSGQLAS